MEEFVKIKIMGQILSETIFRSYSGCVAVKSTSVKDDKAVDKQKDGDGAIHSVAI